MDEQAGSRRGDSKACDCCQERLEQLAAIIHRANAQILAELEAMRQDLAEMSALVRQQISAILKEE